MRLVLFSILIHGLIFLFLTFHPPLPRNEKRLSFEVVTNPIRPRARSRRSLGGGARTVNLRPAYMNLGTIPISPGTDTNESEIQSADLMNINPQVTGAFDHLAAEINAFLEYPSLLIEGGIRGTASLDLYFDARGEIDEARSKFSGDHRALRGLLVLASRRGLRQWYQGAGARLAFDQFRNQHFHADFTSSSILSDVNRIERNGSGDYRFVRRHFVSMCANPFGVDLSCVMLKAYGAVKRVTTREFEVKLSLLEDTLSAFDEMGLRGMREVIRGG